MRRWMRALIGAMIVCRLLSSAWAGQTSQEKWWFEPQRMVQTNLREIDATMDIDKYVRDVKDFGANVVLFNVGGIVANYPTDLENHWRNTFMEGDLVGTVLNRLGDEGIRMIGRFDFSKINEKFATKHPEWLYVSEKGENVNYNGQVHTCVSGGYQQEYMFKIMGEALDRYPLDGVFFNMICYRTSDYSGNYHGLCQCDNCQRLFKEFAQMELPRTANKNDTAYRKYGQFARMMTDRQFRRVNEFLKAKRPDLAICTYTSAGVDVIRKESNRPLGQGPYHDAELGRLLGLRVSESKATHVTLKNSANTVMIFTLSGGQVYVNTKPVGPAGQIDRIDGQLYVSKSLVSQIRPAMQSPAAAAPSTGFSRLSGCVVIDAGHGGKDPGARSILGYYEKTVNLVVAHKVARLLRQRGLRVEMTRTDDRFIELEERVAFANRLRADLFVSIHSDSFPKSSRRGYTMYVANSASRSSRRAAGAIARSMAGTGLNSFGTQTAGYHVLTGTRGPAVLVELGYLTNRREAALLRSSSFQNRLAEAVADGISDYFN